MTQPMTQVDVTRHVELFDPSTFNKPIHVIGAGASGSWLVIQLAKLGLTDITVWDFDIVEEHNIANQMYGLDDIGRPKVIALVDIVKRSTGTIVNVKNEKYTGQRLTGYVFCMIDTMSGRKNIWLNNIKLKSAITLYIEPRMGLDVGRVYNIEPMKTEQHAPYEATLYDDSQAEVSACGASVSVVTSAIALSAWCVRQLIEHHAERELSSEILIDLMYNNIITYKWE